MSRSKFAARRADQRGINLTERVIWTRGDGSEAQRRAVAWLVRNGMGLPSSYKKAAAFNANAMEILLLDAAAAGGDPRRFTVRGGRVFAGTEDIGPTQRFYDEAYDRTATKSWAMYGAI